MSSGTIDARRAHHWLTFGVLAVAVSAFTLLQSLIVPVLPEVQRELSTDQATVTWVLTGYLLSASICTPLIGRIGDVVGKKRMLVFVLTALTVGSGMAALSTTVEWLIVARVVQGAGGGVLPLSFGIIRDEFPRERVSYAISVIASLSAVGFGIGIVVAGPIVDGLGYPWLFWLPMIATAVAGLTAVVLVPESPVRTPTRLPVLPALLLSTWLVALLMAISHGNDWGWASVRVVGLLVVAVVVLVVWVVLESRIEVPLIDMAMMRRRGVWTTNVVAACVGFSMFASFGFLPQFLQTPPSAGYGLGASISESGRLMLPSALGSFLIGFATAPLVRVFGGRRVVVTGTLTSALAFTLLALFHDEAWQVVAVTSIQGFGSGLVFSSLAGIVVASVPPSQTGVASGMNANIRTIGGAVGSAVMAGVVTSHIGVGGLPAERGYTIGFSVMAGLMVVAALAALALPDSHEQHTHDALEDADNAGLGMVAVGSRPSIEGPSRHRRNPDAGDGAGH
ncbi:MFS transporter [Nocardioides pacificus]